MLYPSLSYSNTPHIVLTILDIITTPQPQQGTTNFQRILDLNCKSLFSFQKERDSLIGTFFSDGAFGAVGVPTQKWALISVFTDLKTPEI